MLIVGAGGFVGTCLRYLVGVFARQWFSGAFPVGTFIVNIVGCLIIGLVFGLSEKTGLLSSNYVLLLATGFCGGFTTFSAFANETLLLTAKGDTLTAAVYLLASVVLGILSVWLGRIVVN